MANPCVSALNFGQTTTDLQYGRPFTSIVADQTVNSTLDGTYTGTHAGTVYINQSLTYTNTSGTTQRITPVFVRPNRIFYTTAPQVPNFQEWWQYTIGSPPGAPVLAFQTRFGGGIGYSIGGGTYMSEATATYAPFGQQTLTAGQGIRIDYQCRLYTTFTGSSGRFAYARHHRIIILSDITTDPAV